MIRPLLYFPDLPRTAREITIATIFAALIGATTAVSPLLGIGFVVGIIYGMFALSYPMLNGYIVIIGIALSSGMERGGLIPLLIPNELVLAASMGLAAPYILTVRWNQISLSGGMVITIIIFLSGTIFLPIIIHKLRGVPIGFADIFSLLSPAQYVLLYFLFKYLPRDETDRRHLVWMLLFMSLIIAIVGLLQAANFEPVWEFLTKWYPSSHLAEAGEYRRVTSLLSAWNSLGTFLMLNLLVVRSLHATETVTMNRTLLGIFSFIFLICMVASGSYASIGGLVLGVLILETLDKRLSLRFLVMMTIGGLISYVLLEPLITARAAFQEQGDTLVPQTLRFRFTVWAEIYLPLIRRNWLWGIQPIIPETSAWRWAENHYLYVLYRGGTVALGAHIIWITGTLVWLRGMFHKKKGIVRSLSATSIAILIVLSIMAMTNEVFAFSGVIDYLWIFLGIAASDEHL